MEVVHLESLFSKISNYVILFWSKYITTKLLVCTFYKMIFNYTAQCAFKIGQILKKLIRIQD